MLVRCGIVPSGPSVPLLLPRVMVIAERQRSFSSTTASRSETPQAAIQRLYGVMLASSDTCNETFNPTLDVNGILVVDLGAKGQYSMQASDGQLLLFSPVSGPCYYNYDTANLWWFDPSDGHLLDEKLVREMMHITSVFLNL
jgi:hypothetical protein